MNVINTSLSFTLHQMNTLYDLNTCSKVEDAMLCTAFYLMNCTDAEAALSYGMMNHVNAIVGDQCPYLRAVGNCPAVSSGLSRGRCDMEAIHNMTCLDTIKDKTGYEMCK